MFLAIRKPILQRIRALKSLVTNVYIGTDINPKYGEGFSVERAYLTDAKIAKDNIDLAALVNTDVHVYYNRYGKVDSIQPC